MSTRDEIEFRKSQMGVLITQMVKDKQLETEVAMELVASLKDFLGNGTQNKDEE